MRNYCVVVDDSSSPSVDRQSSMHIPFSLFCFTLLIIHASGEGERVIAPEPWEGTLASRRVEEGLSRSFPG